MRGANLAAKRLLRRATARKPVRSTGRLAPKPLLKGGVGSRATDVGREQRQTKTASEAASGVKKGWRKLYVGDLPVYATRHDVLVAFQEFGPVADVWMARNPPGFSFVEFQESRDAARALRVMDGGIILGSRIKVQFAKVLGSHRLALMNAKKRRIDTKFSRGSFSSRKRSISPLMSRAISPVGVRGRSPPPFLHSPPRRSPDRHSRRRSRSPGSRSYSHLPLPPHLAALYDPHDPHFRQMTMLGAWERGRSPPLLPPLPPLPPYRSRSPSPRSRRLSPKGNRSRSPERSKRSRRDHERSAAASLVYPPLSLPPPRFIEMDSPPHMPNMSPPYERSRRDGPPRNHSPRPRGPPSPPPRRPRSPPYPEHGRSKSPQRLYARPGSPPGYPQGTYRSSPRRYESPSRNRSPPPRASSKQWSGSRSPNARSPPKYRGSPQDRRSDDMAHKGRYMASKRSPQSSPKRNASPQARRPRSPPYSGSPKRRPRSPEALPRLPSPPPKNWSPVRSRSRGGSPIARNRSPPSRRLPSGDRHSNERPRHRTPPRGYTPPRSPQGPKHRMPPRQEPPSPRGRPEEYPPRGYSPVSRKRSSPPRPRSPPGRPRSPGRNGAVRGYPPPPYNSRRSPPRGPPERSDRYSSSRVPSRRR